MRKALCAHGEHYNLIAGGTEAMFVDTVQVITSD